MALEHARLQAEVQAQLEQVPLPGPGSSRPGMPNGAGWSVICTMARSSGW